jgi:hypothetical protein
MQSVSPTTRTRTCVSVECHETTSTTHKAMVKANYRVAALLSLRSNYVNAIVLALAMFYSSGTPLTPAEMQNRTPTHEWVSSVLGEHLNLRPIQKRLAFGVDDVTVVATKGAQATEIEWRGVDKTTASHLSSLYVVDEDKSDQFLGRYQISAASNGAGWFVPARARVCSLDYLFLPHY